ncbi:hypothetical protein C0585_05355 [Candidatus Woesearchaeota archaeon]|nr:MAG: hypothetical protein C0585_05355 [Candidatus Woesearchaeota archaeon]
MFRNENQKKALLLSLFLASFLFFIGYSIQHEGIFYHVFNSNTDDLVNYISGFENFAPFVLLFLIILEVVAAPIPGFIIYVAAGIIFGSFWGGLISFIGNIIGSAICFYIAWKGRTFFFKKTKNKMLENFDRYSIKYGGYAIFLLRVNPFTSTDIFSYLAGFSKMRFKQFIIGTTLGLLPIVFLSSYLGGEIVTNHPLLYKIFVLISILYLAGAIYLIYFARALSKIQEFEKKVKIKVKEKVKNRKQRKK